MAQLTPQEIIDISEPIEDIYQRTVDELLINIAKHFNNGSTRTAYWGIKKLSELGALTKESAAIIAKNTQRIPAEIEEAFFKVAELACKDIDPQLRDAALKGILNDPQTAIRTSPEMRRMVQGYVDQAVDKMNMTNTTMLESTRAAYTRAVNTVISEEQLIQAQKILETQALSVTTGTETRVRAIRKAMEQMSDAGLTGFYDRAGRRWSPEAYTSMVIRTTSHNAAVQSIRTRQMEFGGGDIFQVSSHPGARPLCYPYQGEFFSWSGSGVFEDGAGHEHPYKDIHDSSYGEAAGLFGINCGHHPIPMIPGYSYPQDQEIQSPEENAKEYEESQRQRQYERNIREAKRDLEIAKATGDEQAIKDAQAKVRNEQANMRAFIKETNRPRRYDREQIASTPTASPVPAVSAKKDRETRFFTTSTDYEPQSEIGKALRNSGIERYDFEVDKDDILLSHEIASELAGGDQTKGSCSSLAFAYAGSQGGADVHDFRGGKSCDYFARNSTIDKIATYFGGTVERNYNDFTTAHNLLATVTDDREYYFAVGRHAAIIKKTDAGLQYLELQSRYRENNTWHALDDLSLKRRFHAQRSHTSYGMKYEVSGELIPVDNLKDSEEFMDILTYINTPESKQKKGMSGDIR